MDARERAIEELEKANQALKNDLREIRITVQKLRDREISDSQNSINKVNASNYVRTELKACKLYKKGGEMIKGAWRIDGNWFAILNKRFCYIVRDCHVKGDNNNILHERKFITPNECSKFNIYAISVKGDQAGIVLTLSGTEGKSVIWTEYPDWSNIQKLLTGDEICNFYHDPLIVTPGDTRYKKFREYYDYYLDYRGIK